MSGPAPTIASGALRKLLLAVEAEDLDAAALFAEVGLSLAVVGDPDARVPIATLHALWTAALARAPRADAALLGARLYAPNDYGLVGFVAMNSATLGEALGHVVRYAGLWADEPSLSLDEDGTLTVRYRHRFADGPGLRMATEAALAEVLNGARLLTAASLAPREVRFAHAPPTDPSAHEAFFRCRVRFGQRDTAMVLGREPLALALPRADPQLGALLRTMANDALAKRAPVEPSPLDRVRELIAGELHKGVPALAPIARQLGTSERTLRRRLEEGGSSFRALVDETRAEVARSYVGEGRLPLSEIAFLLGFSEPSAFHRAFKRWTGTTPAAWRSMPRGTRAK